MEAGVLREISRYSAYTKMLLHYEQNYSVGYMMDKRMGYFSRAYQGIMSEHDFCFMIPHSRNWHYFYPKRAQYGYYTDELPFYWEGSGVLAVDRGAIMNGFIPEFGVLLARLAAQQWKTKGSPTLRDWLIWKLAIQP